MSNSEQLLLLVVVLLLLVVVVLLDARLDVVEATFNTGGSGE